VFTLDRWAGEHTWTGDHADECRGELAQRQHELSRAVEQLRTTAWWLEQQATHLDQIAALARQMAGG
jgi:ABC-type transporter Mla subunit MlaD